MSTIKAEHGMASMSDGSNVQTNPTMTTAADPTMTLDPTRMFVTGPDSSNPSPPTFLLTQRGAESTAVPTSSPQDSSSFTMIELLGRGGMGEVWRATQQLLGRFVAVKCIRRNLRSTTLRRAFLQEARITARLEHPNIVPVHELGFDEDGEPLLAMKLVTGVSWSQRIEEDWKILEVEEFLARHLPILQDVCQAVAYAHDQHVVHRDLKPGQVMLGPYGEVLLMDWGLAVYLGNLPETAPSIPTPAGLAEQFPTPDSAASPAGTPVLMAPEQTDPDARRIGPWTDTYLLAGCLYHLLTGTFPHESETSARSMELAQRGEITPLSLRAGARPIPPELEALCLRGLRPEPQDRIATAEEFRKGIEDFLAGTSRRRESLQCSDQAKEALQRRDFSDEEYQQLFSLLDRALQLWGGNGEVLPLRDAAHRRYGMDALQRGDLALARIQAGYLKDSPDRRALLDGITREEARLLRRERQRRWALAGVGISLVIIAVGSAMFSARLTRERNEAVAAKTRAEAAEKNESDARAGAEGLVQFMLSDLRERLAPIGKLDLLNSVGEEVLNYYSRTDAALSSPSSRARQATALTHIARIRQYQGRMPEALEATERALSLVDSGTAEAATLAPDLAAALARVRMMRGDLLLGLGRMGESIADFRSALRIQEGLLAADPGNDTILAELSLSWTNVAYALEVQNELAASREAYARALEIREARLAGNPDDPRLLNSVASGLINCGGALEKAGELRESLAYYRRGVELVEPVFEADPNNAILRGTYTVLTSRVGNVLFATGDHEGALEVYLRDLGIHRETCENDPENLAELNNLSWTLRAIGSSLRILGRTEESRQYLTEATTIGEQLVAETPEQESWRRDLARTLEEFGELHRRLGELDAATEKLSRSVSIMEELVAANPESASWRSSLAIALLRTARLLEDLGDAAAGSQRDRAISILESIAAKAPAAVRVWLTIGLLDAGRLEDARPLLQKLQADGHREFDLQEAVARAGLSP